MTLKYLAISDFSEINQVLTKEKAIIFKHSTQCPISSSAFEEFNSFLQTNPQNISAYYVDVIKDRPVSLKIAETLNVQHESPQVIILENGKVKFHTSHRNISKDLLIASI